MHVDFNGIKQEFQGVMSLYDCPVQKKKGLGQSSLPEAVHHQMTINCLLL